MNDFMLFTSNSHPAASMSHQRSKFIRILCLIIVLIMWPLQLSLLFFFADKSVTQTFPDLSTLCNRCKVAEGTINPLFLNMSKTENPETALLWYSTNVKNWSCSACTALVYGMIIGKRCILKLWKSDSAPATKIVKINCPNFFCLIVTINAYI